MSNEARNVPAGAAAGEERFARDVPGIAGHDPEATPGFDPARARALAQQLPPGIAAYGVNLGPDIVAALATARAQALPGTQLGAGQGASHPLARRLGLDRPGLIVAVGRDGRLHQLSTERDLAAALAQLK